MSSDQVHDRTARLAFVVTRYGEQVLGGAETMVRELAEALAAIGYTAEVFTSCATDLDDWRNTLPAGESRIRGVTIHRYPMHWVDRERHADLHAKILFKQALKTDEQFEWLHSGPHSPELYRAVAARVRGNDFDLIFLCPYLFPLIHYAAAVAPSRSVIWPCLHDEVFAYLAPTQLLLRSSRGLMFNSAAEYELAKGKLQLIRPRCHVVGHGVGHGTGHGIGPNNGRGNADRFRSTFGIREPFLLYSGRLEGAKNVPMLIEYFTRYKTRRRGDLKLALMGAGPVNIEHRDIVLLGFRQGEAKSDAYAAALALCQPSINESFSIALMESWQAGRPVIVHGDCSVTHYHATHSSGGLFFCNYDEFEAVLDLLTTNAELNHRMGEAGQRYVKENYNWPAVLARFEAALCDWCPAPMSEGPRLADGIRSGRERVGLRASVGR